MLCSFDRTGFPLGLSPEAEVEFHLLPVTKLQFEEFLAEPNGYGDAYYERLLALNPRTSLRKLRDHNLEGAFVTGVYPEEALAFAEWLGDGYDLPTVEEWRALHETFAPEVSLVDDASRLIPTEACAEARQILSLLAEERQWATMREVLMLRDGLVEWVRDGDAFVGLGSPRGRFQPNLWDPSRDVVRPLQPRERYFFFGFRLVRRYGCRR